MLKLFLNAGADPKFGYPSPKYLLPPYPTHSGRPAHIYSRVDAPLHVPGYFLRASCLLSGRDFVDFRSMSEPQLYRWALDNPERLHTRGCGQGNSEEVTLLRVAVEKGYGVLAECLIDDMKMGKDGHVNPCKSLLHLAKSAGVMRALLRLPIDLTARCGEEKTILMHHARQGRVECVEVLLKQRQVIATINSTARGPEERGYTALHFAREWSDGFGVPEGGKRKTGIVELLFQAGTDVSVGLSPFFSLPGSHDIDSSPANHLISEHKGSEIPARIVEPHKQAWEERGSVLLIKICRIIAIENSMKNATFKVGASKDDNPLEAVPVYLRNRVQEGRAVPQVEVNDLQLDDEEKRRLRRILTFVVGVKGVEGKTMPGGVFVVVMGFLIAPWNNLRKRSTAAERKGVQSHDFTRSR